MKDTTLNRLKFIEHIVSGDFAFDIDCYMAGIGGKRTPKADKKHLKEASTLLNKIYLLAHGGVSSCCKGVGAELIKQVKE